MRDLGSRRPKRGDYHVAHLAWRIQHLTIGEADQVIPKGLQDSRSLQILELSLFGVVRPTIDLDDQPRLEANEIGDITAYRNLPPKLGVREPPSSDEGPKPGFGVGLIAAKAAGYGDAAHIARERCSRFVFKVRNLHFSARA